MPLNRTVIITVGLVALIGVVILLAATGHGIGVTPDSTVYLGAAGNLLNGLGLTAFDGTSAELRPLTHYPPLYSTLLAMLGLSGIPVESVARWLNAGLLGANAVLVAVAIRTLNSDSVIAAVLGATLVVTAPDVLAAHSFALTEPLFIFFTLIGGIFLIRYVKTPSHSFLIAAAVAIALSGLTRYIGGAAMLAGVLLIVFLKGRSFLARVRDVVLFGAIAFAPSACWALRNMLAAKQATDRQIAFHPVPLEQLAAAVSTIGKWFLVGRLPGSVGMAVNILLICAIFAAGLFAIIRYRGKISLKGTGVLLLLVAAYIGFLIFTASFVDADTVFDARSLVPVHILAIILIPSWGEKIYAESSSRLLRCILVAFVIAIIISYGIRSSNWFFDVSRDGQLYSGSSWTQSPIIATIKELNPDAPIYSNGNDAIYYLTGRRAAYLPETTDHRTRLLNVQFDADVERIRKDLALRGGYLVYFNTLGWKPFMPSENDLGTRMNLCLIASGSDGAIYMVKER